MLRLILQKASHCGSLDVITVVTAKDWVKLRERSDVGEREFLIARHAVRIEPATEFRAWLERRLDERQTERPPQ